MKTFLLSKPFAIALLCLSITLTNGEAISAGEISCKDALANGRFFDSNDLLSISNKVYDTERERGEFETKKDFAASIASAQLALDLKVAAHTWNGLAIVKYDISEYLTKYLIDKTMLVIADSPIKRVSFGKKAPKKPLYGFIFGQSKIRTSEIFGGKMKIEEQNSYGVAFSTKMESAFLQGKESKLSLKLEPAKARELKPNLSLVVVGKIVRPYTLSISDFGVAPIRELPHRSDSQTYVIMDVSCAAVIDKRSKQIVHELK